MIMESDNKNETKVKKGLSYVVKESLQWIGVIVIAMLVTIIIKGFLFEPTIVRGESMENTLYNDQILISYKLGNIITPPVKKDIVILLVQNGEHELFEFIDKYPILKRIFPSTNDINYIKRVIATEGDTVDIKNDGFVYLNDKKLIEPYIKGNTYRHSIEFPITIPAGKLFVLGDNREYSKDSREIGLIEIANIKGTAVFRLRPFSRFGVIK
jgi:signal peptidase I